VTNAALVITDRGGDQRQCRSDQQNVKSVADARDSTAARGSSTGAITDGDLARAHRRDPDLSAGSRDDRRRRVARTTWLRDLARA
jgi:hypothetical protein